MFKFISPAKYLQAGSLTSHVTKGTTFLSCNSCVSLKIFYNFGKTIFSERFPMKQIQYFSEPVQYLIHSNVEYSVIGMAL